MPFKLFAVPVSNGAEAERELNGFLQSHRVLTVDRQLVAHGPSSFWSFCVDYLAPGAERAGPPSTRPPGAKAKIDYREVLKPDEFAVYARLRDLRKGISHEEAVPVYMIFTNEQLAQMVQTRAASKADLEKIAGVGNARVEKYGPRFLEVLVAAWSDQHEANQSPARGDR
jgi:superfamily II DNA helicase RecQ